MRQDWVSVCSLIWDFMIKIKSFPFDREDYYTSLKREVNSFFTKNPSGAPSYLSRESDGQSNVTNLFVDFLLAKNCYCCLRRLLHLKQVDFIKMLLANLEPLQDVQDVFLVPRVPMWG